MRKLRGIRLPIANATEPARIHVKQLEAKFGGIANHAEGDLFIDQHAAAPTVVYDKWVLGIFPGLLPREHLAHPTSKQVAGSVRAPSSAAKKNPWSFKRLSRL